MPDAPKHPVDIYVGMRVRLKRREIRISQDALAKVLGITFQQVQKYESGGNRISASRLFELAGALDTPIGWFFEGLPSDPGADEKGDYDEVLANFVATPDGLEVARIWPRLNTRRRKELTKLIQAMDWAT